MKEVNGRRTALKGLGLGMAAGAAALASGSARSATATDSPLLPEGASDLRELTRRVAAAPRRRHFKTVPMILNHPDQWDHEALTEVIGYRAGPRQVWDNQDLGGPWLNFMRNAINAQVWSFKHPNFLTVSITHGTAHLAMFDQATWDKYDVAKWAGPNFKTNTLIHDQPAAAADPKDYENDDGVFSLHDNSVVALQRRGVVFFCCHNAIWEFADKLINAGINPDKLSQEALAADLTNHLIPGAVLTPGVAGTLPELQRAGFHYAT